MVDLKEKIIERRHDEVVAAMKNVATAVKAIQPKEDSELKAFLAQNKEAITAFVKATKNIKPTESIPEQTLGTINNAINSLVLSVGGKPPLLYRFSRGSFQLNPRYAYKGSTSSRLGSLKTIIELGCKEC